MLINKEQVFLDLDVNSKIDVLKFISEKAREFNITDSSEGFYKKRRRISNSNCTGFRDTTCKKSICKGS